MEQNEIFDSPYSLTRTAILDLFSELGRVPIADVAKVALDRGLIEDGILRQCQMRGVVEFCRRTLKAKKTAGGLPFARPIGDEDGSWDQLRLFTYEELCGLIRRDNIAVNADIAELVKLVDYCKKRFGKAPEITGTLAREMVEA